MDEAAVKNFLLIKPGDAEETFKGFMSANGGNLEASDAQYLENAVDAGSKNGSAEYGYKVTLAKRVWLAKHLASVKFDKVDIIDYGMPKHLNRKGILFDDEEKNRLGWGEGAYTAEAILETLKAL